MKDRNKLIATSTILFLLVVVSVFTVFVITKPNQGNVTPPVVSGENVGNISNNEDSSAVSDVTGTDPVSSEDTVSSQEPIEPEVPQLVLPPDAVINSSIAVVYDVNNDTVIFSRDAEVQSAPASLTKLVTALVALDYLSPMSVVSVGEEINMIGENSSVAFLQVGQKYKVETLLDALLIPSGNDAAYVLAVSAARAAANDNSLSREKAVSDFVRLMNEKVKDLGCLSTYFVTPDGYDAQGQVTTGMDILKISIAAANNSNIRQSVAKDTSRGWINSNVLVRKDSSFYNECVTGLKTGSTTDAGYCLSVSAMVEDKPYIMVFMNSPTPDGRFRDTNTIIDLLKTEESSADVSTDY